VQRDSQRDPNRQRAPREPRAGQETRPENEPMAAVRGAPAGVEGGEATRRRRDRRRGGRDRGEEGERSEPRAPTPIDDSPSASPAPRSSPAAIAEPLLTAHEHAAQPTRSDDETPPSVWTPVVPDESLTGEASAPAPASALVSAEPPAPSAAVQPQQHHRSDAPVSPQTPATNGGDAADVHAEAARPRDVTELPKVSLELPPDSDLVLIETARERVAATGSAEPVEPPRPRRVRPTRTESGDEPLQLVETTHKDSAPPAA